MKRIHVSHHYCLSILNEFFILYSYIISLLVNFSMLYILKFHGKILICTVFKIMFFTFYFFVFRNLLL